MPTHQIDSGLEAIYFIPVDRAWKRIAMSLVAIAKKYDVSPQFEELDVHFPTLISGPRENLRNFLADPRLENAWWQLSDDFRRQFSSAAAQHWLQLESITFDYSTYLLHIRKDYELMTKYGAHVSKDEFPYATITASLWRIIFILKDKKFEHDPRFWVKGRLLTGRQVITRLRLRYLSHSVDFSEEFPSDDHPVPSLSELFPRPWDTEECCLGDSEPCEFCEWC